MNRMFDFKMMIKAMLIVTLSLAIAFASGCRKKQPDKTAQTTPAPVSNSPKSPERDALSETPAVEANDPNVEAGDQNVVTLPDTASKETVIVPDTNTNTTAVTQDGNIVAVDVHMEPATTEKPSPEQLEEVTSSEPLDLNSFGKTDNLRKKFDFISKFAGESPGALPELVDKALDDEDPGIRVAAMDEIANKGFYSPEIIPVVEKAMGDPEPQIRQKALDACSHINDPAVSDILSLGMEDENEDVRAAAIKLLTEQTDPAIRLPVLKKGITSSNPDFKAAALPELMRTRSPEAVKILLEALKDKDPDYVYTAGSILESILGQKFDSYEQGVAYVAANPDAVKAATTGAQNLPPVSPNSPP